MIKKLIINTMALGPIVNVGGKVFRQYVPIFMLHRFKCDEIGINGHDLKLLLFAMEFLRKHKFNFVSIEDIAQAIADNEPLPEKSVAFSLDDGYWDQVEAAGLVFACYDCPATYFVTSGFINEQLWFWDAKINFLLENASANTIKTLGNHYPHLDFDCYGVYEKASKIIFDMSNLSIDSIEKNIALLSVKLEVEIPEAAPEKYRATTWSRLRDMERAGMRVGPHTYSHPFLSRENDEKSKEEISRSKQDLSENLTDPANVFCYPVGRSQDFTLREEGLVREMGFLGAVSAVPANVDMTDASMQYSMPRFGFPDTKEDFIMYATWIESFKDSIYRR